MVKNQQHNTLAFGFLIKLTLFLKPLKEDNRSLISEGNFVSPLKAHVTEAAPDQLHNAWIQMVGLLVIAIKYVSHGSDQTWLIILQFLVQLKIVEKW